jgi:hypothetical protein
MENTVISHYPVLESLVAFAIVFLIGFLVAKSKRSGNPGAPKQGMAFA